MALAIFDLDNTLLGGDSDHAWGEFACEQGLVNAAEFAVLNDAFYADYQAGKLDIHAYLRHALSPLIGQSEETINRWHRQFMGEKVEAMILPAAIDLVEQHRQQGDVLLVITATNRFIAEPIIKRFGIAHLIASEGEIVNGVYTGEGSGTPSYSAGKVTRLQQWMQTRGFDLAGSCFYSDSHNDIPLLSEVERAIAVDPDEKLRAHANKLGWPVISLRG
jgi:HAD superfamily hydrolase (TIGR01490 family)